MAGSVARVSKAAADAGLEVEIRRTPGSTRTAEQAADQCGCTVAQIVKSLVFEGATSGSLFLFLVSGSNQLELDKAAALAGETLKLADPRRIRAETGFAIGGVAPIGHLVEIPTFADETLLGFDRIWAAAGAPDAAFASEPKALFSTVGAVCAKLAS